MRTLLRLIFAPVLVLGASCADERDYPARSTSPIEIEIEPAADAGDARVPIVDLGPHRPIVPGVDAALVDAGVADAGRRDAGPRDAGFDARVPDAAPPDASFDANDTGPDSSIADWRMPTGEQVADVSFAIACDPSATTPGSACRAWPWHEPLCYRTPTECAAIHESTYCMSISANGAAVFTSLDTGASCASQIFYDYPLSTTAGSLAWVGADLYTMENGVTKHALADGSFDITARQANALFAQGDQIILHVPDGSLVRYPSWEDMKRNLNGQAIPFARPALGAVFGANADTIAAVWPSGELALIRGDSMLPAISLRGYTLDLDGPILGLDLDEASSQAYLLTWQGISTFDLASGNLLSRIYAPGMQGLQCNKGLALGSVVPPVPSSPRPGFYYTDREDSAIVQTSDCEAPFNGPRFYGQSSGPELLMLGSYFAQDNRVADQRVAPHTLVLTSIQPSNWNVEVVAGSGLERILVNGNANQVSVRSSAPIPVEYYLGDNALGSFDGNWPTWGEAVLRENLERSTGRAMTEILGCYLGATYTIRNVEPLCALP